MAAASQKSASSATGGKAQWGTLPDLLGFQLNAAKMLVFDSFVEQLAEHDLSARLFGMLAIIGANAGINQTDLSSLMGVDRSQTVRSLDELEEMKLVRRTRDSNDRRVQLLSIESKGQKLLDSLTERVRIHERKISKRLSALEQYELMSLLTKLNES